MHKKEQDAGRNILKILKDMLDDKSKREHGVAESRRSVKSKVCVRLVRVAC